MASSTMVVASFPLASSTSKLSTTQSCKKNPFFATSSFHPRGLPAEAAFQASHAHVIKDTGSPWDPVQATFPRETRRDFLTSSCTLASMAALLPLLGPTVPTASAEELQDYVDKVNLYQLKLPADWIRGEGMAGTRKVVGFYPAQDSTTNVSMLVTFLGADFTRMGSFGTPDIFAENLVNSLDRSWTYPPGQEAKLLSASSRNGVYYVEYTVQKPNEPKRHLLSAVGVGQTKYYNQLYTLTGQYVEEDAATSGPIIREVIDSFSLQAKSG